jgi:hypothetical protein
MQEQQETGLATDLRRTANLLYIVAESHASCVTPFLRHSFGTNMPGMYGIFAILLMLFAFVASEDIGVLCYLVLWFPVLICQRMRTFYLFRCGWREHSRYSGWPWLAKLIPYCKTESDAKAMEPAICIGIGFLLLPLSPGTGVFVGLGGVSLFILRIMQLASLSRQVTAMHDMELEQRVLMERVRHFRNRP